MSEARPDTVAEPPDAHLESLVALILARHGDRIAEGEHDRLREAVKGLRDAAAALYAYPLANADEPDATFFAVQGED